MPTHVASEVKKALKTMHRSLSESKIIILGAAFKSNVPELRYSPSIQIQKNLSASGADVFTYDPLCSRKSLLTYGYRPVDSLETALKDADCLIITTGYDVFSKLEYKKLVGLMRTRLIFDCCGLIRASDSKEWSVFLEGLGNGASRLQKQIYQKQNFVNNF